MGTVLGLEVIRYDKDGNEYGRESKPVNSWLVAISQLMESAFNQEDISGVVDEDGSSHTVSFNTESSGGLFFGAVISSAGGIIVGTGNTAVDRDDNALDTKIADGTGSGELDHQTTTVTRGSITGGYRITIARTFLNSSGGQVTVAETGLIVENSDDTGTEYPFLILRDVLGTPEAIPNGETRTFRYLWDFTA